MKALIMILLVLITQLMCSVQAFHPNNFFIYLNTTTNINIMHNITCMAYTSDNGVVIGGVTYDRSA